MIKNIIKRYIKSFLNITGIEYCQHEFETTPSKYLAEGESEDDLVEMEYMAEICKHCGIEYCDLSLHDPYHFKRNN